MPSAASRRRTASRATGHRGTAGAEEIDEGLIGGTTSTGRTAVLVGYGVKQTEAKRRPRTTAPRTPPHARPVAGPSASPAATAPSEALDAPVAYRKRRAASRVRAGQAAGAQARQGPRRRPRLRHPEREGGIVTRADVEAAAAGGAAAGRTPAAAGMPPGSRRRPAARETRVPVKGVRKMTAQAMVGSAFTAPHVTEWVTVDVTATMELVERLKQDKEFRDVKVTPLLVLAKAMCLAVRRNPGDQRELGRGRRRRSCSSTTSTSASRRPPRAGSSSPTSRTPTA